MVLDVDPQKRRISLGLKQTLAIRGRPLPTNTQSAATSKARSAISPSWAVYRFIRRYRRDGSPVRHRLEPPRRRCARRLSQGRGRTRQGLDIDVEKERISLGIKQLEADPFKSGMAKCARARSLRERSPGSPRAVSKSRLATVCRLYPQIRAVARHQRAAPRSLCGR